MKARDEHTDSADSGKYPGKKKILIIAEAQDWTEGGLTEFRRKNSEFRNGANFCLKKEMSEVAF